MTTTLVLVALTLIVCSTARSRMAARCSSQQTPRSELHCGQRNLHQADSLKRFLVSHPLAGTRSDRQRLYRDARWLRRYAIHHISQARIRIRDITTPSVDECLHELIYRESRWNVHATNPYTGAYGLPQALPGSKMASAGADWRDNAATQIRWMLGYVSGRYGSTCSALAFQKANGWY